MLLGPSGDWRLWTRVPGQPVIYEINTAICWATCRGTAGGRDLADVPPPPGRFTPAVPTRVADGRVETKPARLDWPTAKRGGSGLVPGISLPTYGATT